MYTDADLTAAVQAGVISAEAADALRHYTAQQRQSPAVDEENFRLLNSFNDVFVVIASVLLLVAVGVLGGSMLGPIGAGVVGLALSACVNELILPEQAGGWPVCLCRGWRYLPSVA